MKPEELHWNKSSIKGIWGHLSAEFSKKKLLTVSLNKKAGERQKLLIIDNEWNMLKLLYAVLSSDYDLIIKNSPFEALNWIENGNQPSLIISEYKLPFFDGASFIQLLKIRGFSNNIPVLILSGADDFEQKLAGLPFHIDGMIRKPFNPSNLKMKIKNILYECKSTIAY